MTIRTSPNPFHPGLLDATFKFKTGLFRIVCGFIPEQIEFLKTIPDEQEVDRIVSSAEATEIVA